MSYFVPERTDIILSQDKTTYIKQLADKIDHLNVIAYAFLKVSPEGKVVLNQNDIRITDKSQALCGQSFILCDNDNNRFLDVGNLDFFALFQNKKNDLKKTISFGGADDKQSFFYALKHPANFINAVNAIIHHYKLSGIDLDFEINRLYTPTEANAYVLLIKKLRKKLGPSKLISLATIIDIETLKSMGESNWKTITKEVDYISMMCYDLASAFSKPSFAQLTSNLYHVSTAPKFLQNANASCDESIAYLRAQGVPANKIVLGIPAYAIAYGGVDSQNKGLFQPSIPAQTPTYDDMGEGLLRYSTVIRLKQQGFKAYDLINNNSVNGAWLYNADKRQFVSYDNLRVVANKVDYVIKNNLAGVMIWRIGQDVSFDDKESLLKTIFERMH